MLTVTNLILVLLSFVAGGVVLYLMHKCHNDYYNNGDK